MKRILIVGGGASGMMAAIMAAKNGADVTVYEKNERVGKKILATGNGKCNLTNLSFDISMYNSDDLNKLKYYFSLFDEKETIRTFSEFGLLLKDKNGYIYPNCEQASVVLDVLRNMLDLMGIKVVTNAGVKDIKALKDGFEVISVNGKELFDAVIIATGSNAGLSKKDLSFEGTDGYTLAGRLGHKINPVLPALVQLECEETFFPAIAGVRCECNITLYNEHKAVKREFGELMITDYGISGIPVFQMSSEVSRRLKNGEKLSCVIDFLPEFDEDTFEEFMSNRIRQYIGMEMEIFFLGLINKKLCMLIIKENGFKANTVIDNDNMSQVYKCCMNMKQFVVTVKKTRDISGAQVCTGGVSLYDLDEKLQSKRIKNLYFCGEVADVDGRCGGYNLQWAWTSGAIAGVYAAKE